MHTQQKLTGENLARSLHIVCGLVGEARDVLRTTSKGGIESAKVRLFSKEANEALVRASLLLHEMMDELREQALLPETEGPGTIGPSAAGRDVVIDGVRGRL